LSKEAANEDRKTLQLTLAAGHR